MSYIIQICFNLKDKTVSFWASGRDYKYAIQCFIKNFEQL